MAWAWSHTTEGITNALNNVERLDDEDIITCMQEWHAYDAEGDNPSIATFNAASAAYPLGEGNRWEHIEALQERMQEQATCDNGGHNAWVCPYGCHTVPFSPTASE